ncbi:hypothetical protein BgiMline_031154, partial [Biomphalaria glabrata]
MITIEYQARCEINKENNIIKVKYYHQNNISKVLNSKITKELITVDGFRNKWN